MAKSDAIRIAVVEETVAGTTPTSPVFRSLRVLSETLGEEQNSTPSAELSGDRGVTNEILGGSNVTGSLEAYMLANADFDNFLGGLLGGAWAANVLVPGFTVRTWTIEKTAPVGVGGSNRFLRFKGVGIGSLELSALPQQAITASWGFVGGELFPDTAIESGATYVAASPTPELAFPMRSAEMAFVWGGNYAELDPATSCHTGMSLSLNPNNSVRECLGETAATAFEPGRLIGELTVSMLHTRFTFNHYDYWKQGLEGSLVLTLADQNLTPNNHTYDFNFARLKLKQISTPTPGQSQDVLTEMVFSVLQPTGGDAIEITRATA